MCGWALWDKTQCECSRLLFHVTLNLVIKLLPKGLLPPDILGHSACDLSRVPCSYHKTDQEGQCDDHCSAPHFFSDLELT